MKFQLTDTYLYWWPVTVECPDPENPGKSEKQSFTMQFLAISQDEADAMQEQFAALSPTEQRSHRNDQILRACKDWRDVVDAAGNAIPFSEDALRRMLQYSWSRIGIFDAYAASLAPGAARQGN